MTDVARITVAGKSLKVVDHDMVNDRTSTFLATKKQWPELGDGEARKIPAARLCPAFPLDSNTLHCLQCKLPHGVYSIVNAVWAAFCLGQRLRELNRWGDLDHSILTPEDLR